MVIVLKITINRRSFTYLALLFLTFRLQPSVCIVFNTIHSQRKVALKVEHFQSLENQQVSIKSSKSL